MRGYVQINKCTYLHLPLAMSTCNEVGSDVHALIKDLAIRRIEKMPEIHSNEVQHLAEGTGEGRLWRRFSFLLQPALSFGTRHHLWRQGVALASTRKLRPQGPVSVHAYRTGGVTGSEGQEGANGGSSEIGVGGENGDGNGVGVGVGNGDVNGDGDGEGAGAGAGAGTGTGVEANLGARW